jgi:hypothetical protein
MAFYIDCFMDRHIHRDRWATMNGTSRDGTMATVFRPQDSALAKWVPMAPAQEPGASPSHGKTSGPMLRSARNSCLVGRLLAIKASAFSGTAALPGSLRWGRAG